MAFRSLWLRAGVILLACISGVFAGEVDFRYAPPWWQASICMPDDPEKSLVGKEGQFLFDYGGKGPRNFEFLVLPELEEYSQWVRQATLSPRVPVVKTTWDSNGIEMTSEAFLVVPAKAQPTAPKLQLVGRGCAPQRNWAKPTVACDPAFAHVMVGWEGAAIVYEAQVPAKASAKVAFGLCEGHWQQAGQRPLKLVAEGGAARQVDPIADFGGRNVPGVYLVDARDVDGNGRIRISVEPGEGAKDRNTILNALWVFAGEAPAAKRIVGGKATGQALAYVACGLESLPPHRYAAILTVTNNLASAHTRRPVARIVGVAPVSLAEDRSAVLIGQATRLMASTPIDSLEQQPDKSWLVRLAPLALAPGDKRQVAFTILRHAPQEPAISVEEATRQRQLAVNWWEKADLPWDTIQVPDPAIQGLLESCVRNIWQAREIKGGQPAFHVGPTCYRGLWVVDGAFLLEAAAIVGRASEARAGIHYILGHQKPDGSMDVMGGGKFHKEHGIVLWTCCRHAVLTQDKAWLESVWPQLEKLVASIARLRQQSRELPPDLDDGLMPPGFTDGGIGGVQVEYSNAYWNLAGMKAAIDAAEWLGKKEQAAQWRQEYEDFMATFRKAAARDMATDPKGNAYLPTIMGPEGRKQLPQRGQWAFLHAVYPGQVFAQDDALVRGNLAMLRATCQQGLVFGTGWDAEGIWTYAASFYGHALLWQGDGAEAARVLYAYANHAAPVRCWREEQRPVGKGGHEVGDMPHNWASAEFIRLATHLIEIDRGDELHLLEGLPRQWAQGGMTTRLNGVPTPFGRLSLRLAVAPDGKSAELTTDLLPGGACSRIVVHAGEWAGRKVEERFVLEPGKGNRVRIEIRQ